MYHHSSKYIFSVFSYQRAREERKLQPGNFTGYIVKSCTFSLLIFAIIILGMGFLSLGKPVSIPIFLLGLFITALLPTYFSYRCHVDKESMKITYWVLFFEFKKEVHWKNIAYKRVNRDNLGDPRSILLYDIHKKKVASFDAIIVGFGRIIKITKSIPKLNK